MSIGGVMARVLVTGGAGYVGCVLVPKLLAAGHEVLVYDVMFFGSEGLRPHSRLTIVEGDIRDTTHYASCLVGIDCVIHLACISNDPSFALNSSLSKSINFDCFQPLVQASREALVRRFIYVSTSSVYGVSEAPDVTEDHPLVPLTDYNKFKGLCEPILFQYESSDFTTVIIRPATVCGYSPRMRLDLSVNILTNLAINKGKITVFGGSQKRPNIHIEDVTDLYVQLLELPEEKIAGEIFNAGHQNQSISEIALVVKKVVEEEYPELAPIEIETSPSDDLRSYHVSSEKIATQLGFRPQRTVEDAVRDLCQAFRKNKLPNSLTDNRYYNVRTLKDNTT